MTEQPARTPYCHKIRYGVTRAPDTIGMDGSYAPGIAVSPTLVELVYSAARDNKPTGVSASVTGWFVKDGKHVDPESTVTVHFTDGPEGWPDWLAAEARLHDPEPAAVQPPADRAAVLREAADTAEDVAGRLHDEHEIERANGALQVMSELRRLADEAQQEQPVAEEQTVTQLRWGLNDVMWGDDDTITVMLSGPDSKPYWLELEPDRAAVLRQDLAGPDGEPDAAVPPPALTEVGQLRAQVEVLQQDAERDQGLAKVGARCMRVGHQGLIEQGRLVLEGWRFALSTALDLGTSAPWEAIHERVKELAAGTQQPATDAPTTRCPSCDHKREFHDVDGRCWFTVDHGTPGSNLVCPCAPRRGHDDEQQPAAAADEEPRP